MSTRVGGRRWLWAAAALLVFWTIPTLSGVALSGSAQAADKPVPTDRLLPPNVSFYVTVPDWGELQKRWDESLMGRLKDEPKLADFMKELKTEWDKLSEKTKEKTGLTLDEILKIPAGEVSLALVSVPGKGPAFVALLDFGENKETVEKLLDKAEQALEDEGAVKKESSKNDTTIITYTMKKKGEDDDDAPAGRKTDQKISYFQRDSWLVVGSETAALEAVLTRWDGKHKQTFADNDVYQYILERVQPKDDTDAAVVWYVNPIDLVRTGVQQAGQGNLQAQIALGFLEPLGLTKFRAIGGSYDMATDEFDGVSRTLFYVEQPPEGVMNVFHFPAVDQAPPQWVPNTAASWYGVNWDVGGAYEAIEKLVDGFQGEGKFSQVIDDLAKKEGGPKLHLKKDFFDLLSGRMDVYSEPPTVAKEGGEPPQNRTLMSFSLKDGDKMKNTLAKLADLPGFPGKKRDFEGATILEVRNPVPTAGGEAFGLATADGRLLAASDVTLLEQVLRADKDRKPLADDPEYQQIARKFPAKASIAGFQRQDVQMKALYEMLRSGETPLPFGDDIDFEKLPEFEVIQKYLPATGTYAEPDKNGAVIVSFTLKEKPAAAASR